ncbi:hypothetical protein PAECIP111892_00961 [Paenibacillus auburnensis]|uniref:Uncharacterized protein n=1 Tax=Paenibacillus auburnensis TaxID=2905649 RepID=A0ABM9BQR1_9BACL|nr:hypothetical protein [Paenibacillus auburnensis]CAH1192450.1 hypothetical protein PAECIP111892_00961 [Paenibacillus auburnensis]
MSKNKRGKALWRTPSRSRGTCPICGSTRIKLLYIGKSADGGKLDVCKKCDGKQVV